MNFYLLVQTIGLVLLTITLPFITYYVLGTFFKLKNKDTKHKVFLCSIIVAEIVFIISQAVILKWEIFLINIPLFIAFYYKEKKLSYIFISINLVICFFSYNLVNSLLVINYIIILYIISLSLSTFKKLSIITSFYLLVSLAIYFLTTDYIWGSEIILPIIYIVVVVIIYSSAIVLAVYLTVNLEKLFNLDYFNKRADDLKREYQIFASVIHEIKNPITISKGYLDMMDPSKEEDLNRYLPIIKREMEHALLLMKNFINFANMDIKREIVDLHMLVEEIVATLHPMFLNKNTDVKIFFDEEVYVDTDYLRLKQVITNLLKNSLEAIENKNGIIWLNLEKSKSNVKLIIEDNGVGMSEEFLEKIGTPFVTTKTTGNGLGVLFSKEIMRALGGNLSYKSKKYVGTAAILTLPIT